MYYSSLDLSVCGVKPLPATTRAAYMCCCFAFALQGGMQHASGFKDYQYGEILFCMRPAIPPPPPETKNVGKSGATILCFRLSTYPLEMPQFFVYAQRTGRFFLFSLLSPLSCCHPLIATAVAATINPSNRALLYARTAPPRALDDEESTFLQGVEAQRLEAKQRKEQWEAEELRGFAIARANQTGLLRGFVDAGEGDGAKIVF